MSGGNEAHAGDSHGWEGLCHPGLVIGDGEGAISAHLCRLPVPNSQHDQSM